MSTWHIAASFTATPKLDLDTVFDVETKLEDLAAVMSVAREYQFPAQAGVVPFTDAGNGISRESGSRGTHTQGAPLFFVPAHRDLSLPPCRIQFIQPIGRVPTLPRDGCNMVTPDTSRDSRQRDTKMSGSILRRVSLMRHVAKS